MYKWQNKSMLELLLGSDSLQCFFTTVRFMKVVSDADEQALDDLESATKEAEVRRLRSEESYSELTMLAEEADAVLQQIKAEQDMTQIELDEALYSLSHFRQKEENLNAIKNTAQADVNYYANQYANENKPKPTSPQTQAPVQPPSTGGSTVPSGSSFAWPVPSSSYIRYAHLSAYNCYYGQSVSRGQVIGFIGSTGNSTGPHLHFEILTYGTPTNPLSYY